MAKRSAELQLKSIGAIAVLFLALGLTLGIYREPILQTARELTGNLGIDADAANAAYQKDDFVSARMQARLDARDLALRYYRGCGVTQGLQGSRAAVSPRRRTGRCSCPIPPRDHVCRRPGRAARQ
jgi:hypothetical protein